MLVLLPALAQAPTGGSAQGIVVRLDAGAQRVETPVVAHLAGKSGKTDIQLRDDGNAPDVNASDGMWSGATFAEGDEFTVSCSFGASTVEGGPVSWKAGTLQRDLNLKLDGDRLSADAGMAAEMEGTTGPFFDLKQQAPPPSAPQQLPFDNPGGDSTLYVALAGGGLLLAATGYFWLRGGSAAPARLPRGVKRVPEPGLLPGLPPLSDGLQVWTAGPEDVHELLAALLAALARHHRVLVSAPSRAALPPVHGTVYRVDTGRPSVLADAVDALGDVRVLVLAEGMDAGTLKAQAEALPEGVGGIALTMQAVTISLPVVRASRQEGRWLLKVDDREVVGHL